MQKIQKCKKCKNTKNAIMQKRKASKLEAEKQTQLAKVGKAIILISQDLDEIYEISNNICVINNGSLSIPKNTSKISATDIGILMGINQMTL